MVLVEHHVPCGLETEGFTYLYELISNSIYISFFDLRVSIVF